MIRINRHTVKSNDAVYLTDVGKITGLTERSKRALENRTPLTVARVSSGGDIISILVDGKGSGKLSINRFAGCPFDGMR
jgi:hypothetical protein